MKTIRRFGLISCLGFSLLLLAGCQSEQESAGMDYLPLFGDGTQDSSPVVATVNGVAITERNMEVRLAEMPSSMMSRFKGPEGRRLLLKEMVDQVIMVQEAVKRELYNEQTVARLLISERRNTLDRAMKDIGILAGTDPTDEQLREYYETNRDNFIKKGIVRARHVECKTKEAADRAYARLMTGTYENRFPVIVNEFSVNGKSAVESGDLGWFNRGGYIPMIEDPRGFTVKAYDLEVGINPPMESGGRWHVVEIQRREPDRPMSFKEARNKVLNEMLPGFQKVLIDEYALEARKTNEVIFMGDFAPGMGLSVDELFAKASVVVDPNQKMDLFKMIYTDFPESDRADDALFLAGNVALDSFLDRREGAKLLTRLLNEYPDSELAEDTKFLIENLQKQNANEPTTIEDLRR